MTKADRVRKLHAAGKSAADIARTLGMRPATVRLHLSRKAGAGRPKLATQGKRRLSVLVSVETAEWLEKQSGRCDPGRLIDGLVRVHNDFVEECIARATDGCCSGGGS